MVLLESFAICSMLLLPLIGHSQADAWSCTTSSSNIVCEASPDPAACARPENESVPTVLPSPKDVTTDVFAYHDDDGVLCNGVIISWRSSSAQALNSTTGYLLRLFRHQSPKIGELCRYMKVYSTVSSVNNLDAQTRFTYRVEKLRRLDIDYSVEIYPLPASYTQLPQYTSKYFYSDSYLTPPPTNYMSVINFTAHNSQPYVLTGGFKRASHFDIFRSDPNYLYSSYRVLLLDKSGRKVKGIPPSYNVSYDYIEPDGPEYAQFTLYGIVPGKYWLQVRPYTSCHSQDCLPAPDLSNIGEITVDVAGADYTPSRPYLSISASNEVTVGFQVAPSNYYITRYFVKLYRPDGGSQRIVTEVLPTPPPADVWYFYKHQINASLVLSRFKPGDLIIAEVIPQLHSSLCTRKGHCNLNGSCSPCTRSISLDETVKDIPIFGAVQQPQESVKFVWIAVAVALAVLIAVTIGLVLFARHKKITPNDVIQRLSDCVRKNSSRPQQRGFASIVKESKVMVCIAHASCDTEDYRQFIHHLRSVLENHFHFEVVTFTGDPLGARAFEDSDYTLVIYSPKLLVTWNFFQTSTIETPIEQLHRRAVLDLVLKPRPTRSPIILFVAFENVPLRFINNLVNKNSSLQVVTLPSDLRLLVVRLNDKNSLAFQKAMQYYEEGPLKKRLEEVVNKIVSEDSGLGELDYETRTVCTEDQRNDRIGIRTESSKLNTTTPLAYEQRFLPTRQDSSEPTSPVPASPQFPTVTDSGVTGEITAPVSAPQLNHMIGDERKGPDDIYRDNHNHATLQYERRDDDCDTILSSEESFQCSELTSFKLPDGSERMKEPVQTIEC